MATLGDDRDEPGAPAGLERPTVRARVKRVVRTVERAQALVTVPLRRAYERGWMDASRLTLPDFLGIGAAKAGSTWLFHNLRAHPGLYLPPEKELHYFCHRYHRSLRSYARRFAPGSGRVVGEITPNYAILPVEKIRSIGRLMPDLRLLFIVRDPIERAWSHARMRLVRQDGRSRAEVSDAELVAHFRGAHSRANGDYQAIIDRWLSVFPPERLWLGFFEDISQRPRQLLSEVFRHLGVDDDVDWEGMPYATRIDRGVRGEDDRSKPDGKEPIPPHLRRVLEDLYGPSIEGLRTTIGPRVDAWMPR